jgi:hypothetical protein
LVLVAAAVLEQLAHLVLTHLLRLFLLQLVVVVAVAVAVLPELLEVLAVAVGVITSMAPVELERLDKAMLVV